MLDIIEKEEVEEIKSKSNHWTIDIGLEIKIETWDDLYEDVRRQLDFNDFDKLYGRNWHTYNDIITDDDIWQKVQKMNKRGITIFFHNYDIDFEHGDYELGYDIYTSLLQIMRCWTLENKYTSSTRHEMEVCIYLVLC